MKNEAKLTAPSSYLSKFISTCIAGCFLLVSFNVFAVAQLMVSPTRVVFEGNERTKQITLINNVR